MKLFKFFLLLFLISGPLCAYDTILNSVRDQAVCLAAVAVPGDDGSVTVNPAGMLTGQTKSFFNLEYGRYNLNLNLLNFAYYQNFKYLGFGINYGFLTAAKLEGIVPQSGSILNYNHFLLNLNTGVPKVFKTGINLKISAESLNAQQKYNFSFSAGARFKLGKVVRLGLSVNDLGSENADLHYGFGLSFRSDDDAPANKNSTETDKDETAETSSSSRAGYPGQMLRQSSGPGSYGGSRGPAVVSSKNSPGSEMLSTIKLEIGLVHYLSDFKARSLRTGLEWYFVPQFGLRTGLEKGIKYDKLAFDFGVMFRIKKIIFNYTFKRNMVFNQNLVGISLEF